jgi:hypothetical protein
MDPATIILAINAASLALGLVEKLISDLQASGVDPTDAVLDAKDALAAQALALSHTLAKTTTPGA